MEFVASPRGHLVILKISRTYSHKFTKKGYHNENNLNRG